MHCFEQRAWFTQEVQLCCLSSLPVASVVWWEISCQSYWAFLACSQWFPHTHVGALTGAHISLRLSIFLPLFPLCSLGSAISISRSSSCPILPSVSWRPLWSPHGELCTSYFHLFIAILCLMGCHHDTSFTSLWVFAFYSVGIYSSHCETVSIKFNIWTSCTQLLSPAFFPCVWVTFLIFECVMIFLNWKLDILGNYCRYWPSAFLFGLGFASVCLHMCLVMWLVWLCISFLLHGGFDVAPLGEQPERGQGHWDVGMVGGPSERLFPHPLR